jgi:HEAT repeat protein/energy-coupling factor transporter ATP-binding protein EcfA2
MRPKHFLALHAGWLWAVAYQATRAGWRFDPISFAIGLVVALLLLGLIYRYRVQIAQRWDQAKKKANQLRQRLTASMAARYSASAVETAQAMHLLGAMASLDQIYVETQLYAPLTPATDETERLSLSPLQAIQAGDRLVIIGRPGSGRTTLLNHLLLLQAGRLHAAGEDERAPIYAYLPALAAGLTDTAAADDEDEKGDAPAERLARAAVASMSRLGATGVTRWLRGQVEAGNALVLLDGWDEVPATERPAVTTWIQSLAVAYPANRLVTVAGERSYAPLVEAGFVPLRPTPWTQRQLADLTRRWVEALRDDGGPPVSPPDISYRLTPPTPLQATIKLVIQLRGQTLAHTPAGQMAQLMGLLLPPPETDDKGHVAWPLKTGHRALGRLALAVVEQGRPMLEREEIQSTVTEAMPPPQFAQDEEQDEDLPREELKKAREEKEQRTLQVVDCCRALTAVGAPIRAWGNRRYLFVHPLVTDYLAARYLAAEDDASGVATIVTHADDPAWLHVLRFYVGLAPAEPLIQHLLGAPDDLFLNRLWTAAALLGAAPPGRRPWRDGLMARLAQLLMKERWPALLRNRALVALVESGEAGVGPLFKKAVDLPDPLLRAGAMLGLGALEREQDIGLIEAALSDDELDVRLAAVNALGRLSLMGSEPALELVVTVMIEAEDETQRAAAAILAELGGEGHAVLREGATDEDLIVRRAAIYGLAAVGKPWAREILEGMQQDKEWLVRNAAIEALASMDIGDDADDTHPTETPPLDLALPQAETEPWLIAWAAERGEGTGVGEAALATLMRALAEGDAPIRHMAIETLARLADPRTISVLRQSLRDPDPSVREAALVALEEISRRHDMTITIS